MRDVIINKFCGKMLRQVERLQFEGSDEASRISLHAKIDNDLGLWKHQLLIHDYKIESKYLDDCNGIEIIAGIQISKDDEFINVRITVKSSRVREDEAA